MVVVRRQLCGWTAKQRPSCCRAVQVRRVCVMLPRASSRGGCKTGPRPRRERAEGVAASGSGDAVLCTCFLRVQVLGRGPPTAATLRQGRGSARRPSRHGYGAKDGERLGLLRVLTGGLVGGGSRGAGTREGSVQAEHDADGLAARISAASLRVRGSVATPGRLARRRGSRRAALCHGVAGVRCLRRGAVRRCSVEVTCRRGTARCSREREKAAER